jgi:ferredoxin
MIKAPCVLDRAGIDRLIGDLEGRGFTVLGPTVRNGAVVVDEIEGTGDLPVGVGDEQAPGSYRLVERGDAALFRHVVGPTSPKALLHPPEVVLWSGRRAGGSFETVAAPDPPRYAFLGLRPCELAAVEIQDEVFLGSGRRDGAYSSRRQGAFFVAVNCVEPGGTCFCVSMGTGPRAASGYDIALTEVLDGSRHYFLAEVGSEAGADVLVAAGGRDAAETEISAATALLAAAAGKMGRHLDMKGMKEILRDALDSPHWEEVAQRCLTCANCTLVCPTCFCATVEDVTDLAGAEARRVRRWDSCFNEEFSYIHGGPLRPSPYARYRQWLTHKLGTWQDQFGVAGCVGCGRCITWCPVGIDMTAEAAAVRAKEVAGV